MFHQAFSEAVKKFPGIQGLIFADPDGESILFESPDIDEFEVKLAGAKLPILMDVYQWMGMSHSAGFMELDYENRYVMAVKLVQSYTITAIGSDPKEKARLKAHLISMAEKFNKEIY